MKKTNKFSKKQNSEERWFHQCLFVTSYTVQIYLFFSANLKCINLYKTNTTLTKKLILVIMAETLIPLIPFWLTRIFFLISHLEYYIYHSLVTANQKKKKVIKPETIQTVCI